MGLEKLQKSCEDFPGGPVVKNLPSNAGDMGSIPGQGTRSHMPWNNKGTTREKPTGHNARSC